MSDAPVPPPREAAASLDAAGFQQLTGAMAAQVANLERYRALLTAWNADMNLVGPATLPDFWNRHALDSWQLLPVATTLFIPAAAPRSGAESRDQIDPSGSPGQPARAEPGQGSVPPSLRPDELRSPGAADRSLPSRLSAASGGCGRDDKLMGALTWADLGSGAGLPGIVLAIFLKDVPGAEVHLVDSLAKRCRFLAEVVAELDLPARVHNARAEALDLTVDVVTARAVAPMGKLFGYAAPFLARGARGLFLKGEGAAAELEAARQAWTFDAELSPSRSDPRGRIVTVRSLTPRARSPHPRRGPPRPRG